MDFDLDEDQLALRDGARAMLDDLAPTARVRTVIAHGPAVDRDLWDAMVDQGWLGVGVPESEGGLGLGVVELAVLLEETGRHVAPVPFLPGVVALAALRRAPGVADDVVERLLAGEVTACVAWSRHADAVVATRDGSGWTLRGRPDPVAFAPTADFAVVSASTPDGMGVFLVDVGAAGRPPVEAGMDVTRALGWLDLDDTPADHLGGEGAYAAFVDDGATFTALEMLGGAARALDLAVEYAKDRVQFGRPIGSFQAVKHRCADMLVDVEGMRSTAYWAAWCLAAGDPDAPVAASTAKTWCSDAAKRVMASALQVHGGIGFTWEHDLHLFLKRSHLDQLAFGDAVFHRERLTTLLRPKVEAGESVL